jgi:hypothetical protein
MQSVDRKKKMNIFLFFLFFFFFSFYLWFYYSTFKDYLLARLDEVWLLIFWCLIILFMLAGGSIYGYMTHEKMKAAFLGFLFPVMSVFYAQFLRNLTSDHPVLMALTDYEFLDFVLIGIVCGAAGFFAANTQNDSIKRYFLYFLSTICLIAGLWLLSEPPEFLTSCEKILRASIII